MVQMTEDQFNIRRSQQQEQQKVYSASHYGSQAKRRNMTLQPIEEAIPRL